MLVTDSMFDAGRITGDIDIYQNSYDKIKGAAAGSGCIFVNWKVVDFSMLSKNLKLSYMWKEANNPYFLSFKLLWHKLPITNISYNGKNLERSQDNFFSLPSKTIDTSGTAKITINYTDGTSETVSIGGPKDTLAHEVNH